MRNFCLRTSNTRVCFGNSENGLSDRGPEKFVELAAGTTHVCGLLADGNVKCWGNLQEDKGHLLVPPIVKFKQISAGLFFTFVITQSDDVLCWGTDTDNQLTPPSR